MEIIFQQSFRLLFNWHLLFYRGRGWGPEQIEAKGGGGGGEGGLNNYFALKRGAERRGVLKREAY